MEEKWQKWPFPFSETLVMWWNLITWTEILVSVKHFFLNGSKNTCNCGRFLSELFWLSINQANTVSGMSLHGPYYVGYTLMSSESSIAYFAIRCSFEKNRHRWFLIILLDIWFLIMSEIWLFWEYFIVMLTCVMRTQLENITAISYQGVNSPLIYCVMRYKHT